MWGAAKAKAVREREQQRQRQQAAAVEEALARHRAALTQSAEDRKKLAAAWRGGAEDMTALAVFVIRAQQAARAIAGNPALLAALREEDPDQASEAVKIAGQDREQMIANMRRKMPKPSPAPDPEPPTPALRR